MHTLTGDLLRSLDPPHSCGSPRLITISREAFIVVTFDKGHVCSFTINGNLLRYMDHKDTLQVCIIITTESRGIFKGGKCKYCIKFSPATVHSECGSALLYSF